MKKSLNLLIITGLIITASALGAFGQTTTNLNYTPDEMNTAFGIALANSNTLSSFTAITNNLQTAVLTGGMADVAFGSVVVDTAFTETTQTDIDLSAHVGTNAALVILRVLNNTASNNDVRFQTNGESIAGGLLDGLGTCQIDADKVAYIAAVADSSGIIQGRVDGSVHITLIAFVRPHDFD